MTTSNGARLVSANDAVMKMRKPANCGMKYHMPSWAWTIPVNDSVPAVMITPTSDSPWETS